MNLPSFLHGLRQGLLAAACLGLLSLGNPAQAAVYQVSIDTSTLFGVSGQLVFDLIDGGLPANFVTISGFSSDGTLGSSTSTGDVSGSLGSILTLGDTDPLLNEYSVNITLGNSLSFTFDSSNNPPAGPDSSPDGFSFSLLDGQGASLTTTADPSGLNALLVQEFNSASPELIPYSGSSPSVPVAVTAVPIPAALILFGSGMLLVGRRLRAASAHLVL